MDVVEDQEALFHSYQCALYYVQSPSTLSHANSAVAEHFSHNSNNNSHPNTINQQEARFTLSRYSSSRGSNNSFLHEKKIVYDLQSHGSAGNIDQVDGEKCGLSVHDLVKHNNNNHYEDEEEEEDDEAYYYGRRGWWWWLKKYSSFRTSSSCAWISLQITWRFLVSLSVALLVFYLATEPPPPMISIKVTFIFISFSLSPSFFNLSCSTNPLHYYWEK